MSQDVLIVSNSVSVVRGVLLLVFAVILNTFGLRMIQSHFSDPVSTICAIMVAFSITTIAFVFKDRKLVRELRFSSIVLSFFWAIAICAIYWVFLYRKEHIQLSHIIIAQSLAPYFAVYLSGDWRKSSTSELVRESLPLGLLIGLAFVESQGNLLASWGFFVLVCIAFLAAQTTLRKIAEFQGNSLLTQACGTAWVILLVSLFLCKQSASFPFEHIIHAWPFGCLLGLILVVVQFFYLHGLRNAPPVLGALAVSTSVPLSIFLRVRDGGKMPLIAIAFSLLYCALLAIGTLLKLRLQPTVQTR
ncbi:MAG: hypothetical protein ACJ763_03935 [Bdellovibrionia bacterium]